MLVVTVGSELKLKINFISEKLILIVVVLDMLSTSKTIFVAVKLKTGN